MSNDNVTPMIRSTDYTTPIARTGEQQFAVILRNRSGISAGEIDFGARSINELPVPDQQMAIDCLLCVYHNWTEETGLKGAPHLLERLKA